MKTTTYRGLTIEHPTLKRTEVQDVMDYLQTTFRIVEIDNDCISTLDRAKQMIDRLHKDMERFNEDEPEDAYGSIQEYVADMMAEAY